MTNKNKKQAKFSKKRIATLSLGIVFAALIAGSTTALLVQTTGPQPTTTFHINFDKGSGTKIEGKTTVDYKVETTLNYVGQPTVEKSIELPGGKIRDYAFVDWVQDGNLDKPVTADKKLSGNYNLMATFTDDYEGKGLTFHTVTFETKSKDEWLTGVTRVATLSNRTLASINKPEVHSSDENKTSFKGWALKSNPNVILNQNMVITGDITLVPVWETLYNFQFKTYNSKIVRGQDTVSVAGGTTFGAINTPEVASTATDGNYVLLGWFKTDPATWTGSTDPEDHEKWKSEDLINPVTSADELVGWSYLIDVEQSEDYVALNFVINTDEGQPQTLVFSGNTTQATKVGTTWANISRPTPTATGFKLKGWEYSVNDKQTWEPLNDTQTFTKDMGTIYIRPVMLACADSLSIIGPDYIGESETKSYSSVVAPSTTSQEVKWALYADEACAQELDDTIAVVTPDPANPSVGKVTAKVSTLPFIYLKATSVLDDNVFDVKTIAVKAPYVATANYLTFIPDQANASTGTWYRLEGLFDKSQDIELYSLTEGESLYKTIARADFNMPVYVGEKVTALPDGFLNTCEKFNSPVTLSKKTVDIGYNFLGNCPNFNQTLDLSYVQNISRCFLNGCTSFNNGYIEGTSEAPVPLKLSCSTIGSEFLRGNTSFNQPLDLGSKIKLIGEWFLENCTSFNQEIVFPSSLTSVGDFCMYNCNNFSNKLWVKTGDATSSVFAQNYQSFSSTNKEAKIYKDGFDVRGTGRTKFLNYFPNLAQESSSEHASAYRTSNKLSEGVKFSELSWEEIIRIVKDFENNEITEQELFDSVLLDDGTAAGKKATKLKDYCGQTHQIKLDMGNGIVVTHNVVIIGTQQDYQTSGGKRNLFTFQFKEVITSIINGAFYPLMHNIDNWHQPVTNSSGDGFYLTSSMRSALNGNNSTTRRDMYWYYYDTAQKKYIQAPMQKSVFEMLPTELQNAIPNSFKRVVAFEGNNKGSGLKNRSYLDKIFIAQPYEMGLDANAYAGGMYTNNISSLYGNCYYYLTSNERRQHKAVGGTENYAYTSNNVRAYICWHGMPDRTWAVEAFGNITKRTDTGNASGSTPRPVAPCFCL